MQQQQLRCPNAADVAEARRLGEAGWTPTQIAGIFERRGIKVSRQAVGRWLHPEQAEKYRERSKRWKAADRARQGAFRPPCRTKQAKAALAVALSDEGVPDPSIAKTFRVLFGEPDWNRDRVQHLIRHTYRNEVAA